MIKYTSLNKQDMKTEIKNYINFCKIETNYELLKDTIMQLMDQNNLKLLNDIVVLEKNINEITTYMNEVKHILNKSVHGHDNSKKQIEIEELLEIGSNSFNNLLEFSGIAGGVTGISLEATPKQSQNIELIQGSFDSLNFDKKFTIILSRFVLEHIYDLKSHLNKVFDILNISGYFIVQVPNPSKMLSNNVFNVLAHEHLHYFTECSLRTLFAQNGFEIIELLNGNSFLVCAKKSEQLDNSSIAKINSTDINSVLFDQDVFKNLGEYIQSEIYSSRKVVIYGAGLNLIGLFLVNPALRVNPNIQIVDDNYLIIGKFMPNSSIEIIRLDQTQINNNSIIIILANSTYQDLIVDRIKKLGLHNKVFNANLVELNLHN
jgi:hypothetical protein